ncbi:hypothetical protein [Enterococcus villorum]|uniref:hypothetical protein n=1 Tax=Enterococcus villorum TaxID=112904 RepID=UPI001F4D3F05|nr:hypothetical protein [Enterococcus villorum]
MKIIPPKISPKLMNKDFSTIFHEEDPILEMCQISGDEYTDSFLDRPRFIIQNLTIVILQIAILARLKW